jgi:hypothetical protein
MKNYFPRSSSGKHGVGLKLHAKLNMFGTGIFLGSDDDKGPSSCTWVMVFSPYTDNNANLFSTSGCSLSKPRLVYSQNMRFIFLTRVYHFRL